MPATDLPTKRNPSKYGWVPDLPDIRDHMYAAPMAILSKLPDKVDLRKQFPKVYDQGEFGSCTANAVGGVIHFLRMKGKYSQAKSMVPSRMFVYYNTRVIEGAVNQDDGAQIRDVIKTVVKQGVCYESGESAWPYVRENFATKAPADRYQLALKNQVQLYSRVTPTLNQLKGCLASGYPFAYGFTVYTAFESAKVAKTGIVPMPQPKEKVLGGHAVIGVGYDDATQMFIFRNSWNNNWGDGGYGYMPYAYITNTNLADDFWTIRIVEDGN